jgi:hypothetical protein
MRHAETISACAAISERVASMLPRSPIFPRRAFNFVLPDMAMPRTQFTLKTLFSIVLAVATFLGAFRVGLALREAAIKGVDAREAEQQTTEQVLKWKRHLSEHRQRHAPNQP